MTKKVKETVIQRVVDAVIELREADKKVNNMTAQQKLLDYCWNEGLDCWVISPQEHATELAKQKEIGWVFIKTVIFLDSVSYPLYKDRKGRLMVIREAIE